MTDGELAFIERLRRRLPGSPPGEVWLGDDAAVLDEGLLVATDLVTDRVHFDLRWCTPEDAGWKALAVNLSDVAAMGGSPRAAVAALALPDGAGDLADRVADGLADAAERHACPLVGGDTTRGAALTISVTVLGQVEPGTAVLRSGAREGDQVFVTGELGAATAALDDLSADRTPRPVQLARLHRPDPRLDAGRAAVRAGATAMIDLSDGLGADLAHIADESRVGFRIAGDLLPLATGVALERAVTGGDDYELCFTAPDTRAVETAFADAGLQPPTRIGSVTATSRVLVRGDREEPFPGWGWEHRIA